ncbi:MAG: hypothetical protein K940chlam3_00902, partial [Chlamydiae bacterium]|nr:hypothetical protein [Chlamydiota bacterium]
MESTSSWFSEITHPTFQYLQRLDMKTLTNMHHFLFASLLTTKNVRNLCLSILPYQHHDLFNPEGDLDFMSLEPSDVIYSEYPNTLKLFEDDQETISPEEREIKSLNLLVIQYWKGRRISFQHNNDSYNLVSLAFRCFSIFEVLLKKIEPIDRLIDPKNLFIKTEDLFIEFQKKFYHHELSQFEKHILYPISRSHTLEKVAKVYQIVWQQLHTEYKVEHIYNILGSESSEQSHWFIQNFLLPSIHSEQLLIKCLVQIRDMTNLPMIINYSAKLSELKASVNNFTYYAREELSRLGFMNLAVNLFHIIKNYSIEKEAPKGLIEMSFSHG